MIYYLLFTNRELKHEVFSLLLDIPVGISRTLTPLFRAFFTKFITYI